jgi:hypothetical protein
MSDKNWKPLKISPPGTLQGKVPPVQSIMPPGAVEEEVVMPSPKNYVKPLTGLERTDKPAKK